MDIGWSELLLIAIVALIVVGPKELPGLFKTVGQFMGKARGMAREFQRSMEQAAEESGLNEAAKGLKSVDNLNLNSATKSAKSYAKSAVTGGKASPGPDAAPEADPATTAPSETPPPATGATARAPEGTASPPDDPMPVPEPAEKPVREPSGS